jgi:hypothetical protein
MSPAVTASRIRLTSPLLALLAGLAAGGCSVLPRAEPDPTRHFVLESGLPAALPATALTAPVAIAPVTLGAGYLVGTRNLIVRRGGNEIRYEDFARWAEPLDAGIGRILRERIPGSVPVRAVRTNRAGDAAPAPAVVRLEVLRCEGVVEGDGGGVAHFSATYEITGPKGAVVRGSFTDDARAWDGRDPARLAALLGEAVGALATEIGGKLEPPH